MSGWEQTHRRYRLVYAVAADVVRRGRAAVDSWLPSIDAEYGGLHTFLLDVQRRWDLAVDAHIDDVRERSLAEIQAAVAAANRPLRVLLDTFAAQRELVQPAEVQAA